MFDAEYYYVCIFISDFIGCRKPCNGVTVTSEEFFLEIKLSVDNSFRILIGLWRKGDKDDDNWDY